MIMSKRIKKLVDDLLSEMDLYEGYGTTDMLRLWREYLRPHRAKLFVAAFAASTVGFMQMLFPLTGKFLADTVLNADTGVSEDQVPVHITMVWMYAGMLFSI